MKTKIQFLRWLMMLMLSVSALGAWGQPYANQGDDIVCFGTTKHYAVINDATSTYAWTITPTTLGNGNITAGQGTSDITVNWTAAGTCDLQVVETGPHCTGLPVTIHVTVLPQLTAPIIAAAQTICYNTAPNGLTMPTLPTGGNGTYTYQWQISANGTSGWTDIGGATGTTFAPPAMTVTTYYQVIATAAGTPTCGIVPTSNVITITVLPQLTAPIIAAAQTICYGATPAQLTMPTLPTGGNGTYTYQWQSSPDGITWTNITGATGTTFAPPALTTTTSYQVIATATGAQTCGVVPASNVITITVLPQLTAPIIAAAQTICYNTAPNGLTMPTLPTGGNGTYTYQWQISANGTSGWTDIGGATGTTFAPPALTITTYYQVIATATGTQTCGVVPTSNVIKITIDPQLGTSPIYHN